MRKDGSISSARWLFVGLVVALVAGKLFYATLQKHQIEQTAALFVGLPALLAILLALTPAPSSATGVILKGLTVLLLLSGVLLGEGFICILLAAPLFYIVGAAIGLVIDASERRRRRRNGGVYGLVLLTFLPLSLEGVHPRLSFQRNEEVAVERIVPVSASAVARAIASTPPLDRRLPTFLRLRFPTAQAVWGQGLEIEDYRAIRFSGVDDPPGILVLRITERSDGRVLFKAESDTSMISHWLSWKEAEVRWSAAGSSATRVSWTLRYKRLLDPAWYFGPWERYATRLLAGYLIDTVATPRDGSS